MKVRPCSRNPPPYSSFPPFPGLSRTAPSGIGHLGPHAVKPIDLNPPTRNADKGIERMSAFRSEGPFHALSPPVARVELRPVARGYAVGRLRPQSLERNRWR